MPDGPLAVSETRNANRSWEDRRDFPRRDKKTTKALRYRTLQFETGFAAAGGLYR
jgi:hypothetical protein